MTNLFSQNKKKVFKKGRSEENTLNCYQIIIHVQREYGYFFLGGGIFLPLYFSIVSKAAHLSDLGLAFIISSWLFTDHYAWMGPIAVPSPGSVFHLYCNIYHTLMRLIKLSFFAARQ